MTTQTAHPLTPIWARWWGEARRLLGGRGGCDGRRGKGSIRRRSRFQPAARISSGAASALTPRPDGHRRLSSWQVLCLTEAAGWVEGQGGSQGTCQPVPSGPWLTEDKCFSGESSLAPENPPHKPLEISRVFLSLTLSHTHIHTPSRSQMLTFPP